MKTASKIFLAFSIILIITLFKLTGNTIIEKPTKEYKITRILDGDTLELETGQKVRLKGINTPETGMFYADKAKEFLKKLENKTIKLEDHGFDKYGRTLGYIFYDNKNINQEIIRNGLASAYYYDEDNHFQEIMSTEKFARENQIGLWKNSPDKNCIKILEFEYIENPKRCTNTEKMKIQNLCDFEIKITLKDDATHIYKEKIPAKSFWSKNFSCIWNDDGDTIYAWDEKGLLIFQRYN